MAKQIEDEVAYYYDSHPTEEDLMGETSDHSMLISYLMLVLRWLFHGQRCAVYENLNFYQTRNKGERPVAPDIAVIQGVTFRRVKSWRIGVYGPAPQVVFEIASEETWARDLDEKIWKYERMGVEEYYAYDPNDPMLSLSKRGGRRLFGWHRDPVTGVMQALSLDARGRLWSPRLESFLVPDEEYLRLYDKHGQLRLTKDEAETLRADVEAAARRTEKLRADAQAGRAEAEARKSQALAEMLRSLGIDPDQVS